MRLHKLCSVALGIAALATLSLPTQSFAASAPNDPLFVKQWAWSNTGQKFSGKTGKVGADIKLLQAWDLGQGAGVKVGIIDEGIWNDHAEFTGRNHVTSDVTDSTIPLVPTSWNFLLPSGLIIPGEHATHVAGIIGAAANNNKGGVGVAPQAELYSLEIFDDNLPASEYTNLPYDQMRLIAKAMDQAGKWKLPIVNMSLGGPGGSSAITNAALRHPHTLYVVAAGNESSDNDKTPVTPCNTRSPNIICVGASNHLDRPAYFSNWGKQNVDLYAPGDNIISSSLPGIHSVGIPSMYQNMSGTSMATPVVSGVLALMKSVNPSATAGQLKHALLDSVDHLPILVGLCRSGGRVNAYRAARAIGDDDHDGIINIDDAGWVA
jgi:subtilisin family serine protease